MASSVNLRSGLVAVGALRPEEGAAQDPVALETTVIATGARPGDATTKRELFTEETQTVLVFENGAVIRLSAAVADGQLLFLTNKATGKEVVTQVLRKRSFRPTNCYVDLEFTEPRPGFWGIEFPKAAKPASVASPSSVNKKLSADEDSESPADKPAIPPSLQEVERLKNEVAGLQTQLKSLLQPNGNTASEKAAPFGVKSASEGSAELARKEEEKRLEEFFAQEAKQEESNLPKRLVAYPQKSTNRTLQKPAVRRSLIAALVVALAAAGAYRFGAFDALTKKTVAAKAASSHAALAAPVSTAQKTVVASVAVSPATNDATNPSTGPPEDVAKNTDANPVPAAPAEKKSSVGVLGLPLNATVPGPVKTPSGSAFVAAAGVKRRSVLPASELNNKLRATSNAGAVPSAASASEPGGVGVGPGGDGYVGPKLVRGVKPVAPAEALKNYVTGNVNLDALVDATGHIKSVTVISGPEKLRQTAIEDMKQYIYEPARKNGKTVPAHVQVSLQFWYEP